MILKNYILIKISNTFKYYFNRIGIQLSVPDLQFIMNSDFPLIQKFKFYSLITFMGGYNSEIQALFYPKEFREALY